MLPSSTSCGGAPMGLRPTSLTTRTRSRAWPNWSSCSGHGMRPLRPPRRNRSRRRSAHRPVAEMPRMPSLRRSSHHDPSSEAPCIRHRSWHRGRSRARGRHVDSRRGLVRRDAPSPGRDSAIRLRTAQIRRGARLPGHRSGRRAAVRRLSWAQRVERAQGKQHDMPVRDVVDAVLGGESTARRGTASRRSIWSRTAKVRAWPGSKPWAMSPRAACFASSCGVARSSPGQ